MKKRIKSIFFILPVSVLIGILLLIVVYALPVESARSHVKESLASMVAAQDQEIKDPIRRRVYEIKEIFTDVLMVQNALEQVEGKSVIEHAMYIYHYDLSDGTTWETEASLGTYLNEGYEGMFLREYSKYWHGYLIWLKPLLICMSWETAECIWFIMQVCFLLAVISISIYKKQGYLGIGVGIALLFMKPVRIWISFAMCVCWGITLLAVLGMLFGYSRLEEKKHQEEFFLIIGILTSYMDFLTYPIVTLGIPLCVYLVMNMDVSMKWYSRVVKVFWLGVMWGVGYIGMWGMKWVSAEILCQSGTLRNAVWSVIYRTTPLDGYTSAFSGVSRTIKAVFDQYDNLAYPIGLAALVFLAVLTGGVCLIKARNQNWAASVVCLGVIALLPFAWLILTQNHTAIHCWFTFRIMGVTVFALWCMIICSFRTIMRKKRGNGN